MKTVLVVEDSRAAFEILRHTLAGNDKYRVEYFCKNGDKLLEEYELHKPDIVVMDIILAGLNGIEITRRLKAVYPEARVVIITSISYQELWNEAFEAGAMAYIQKPYHLEQVIQAFDAALENHGFQT